MSQVIYQVDAFADRPFAGNPAAVCILPERRDSAWMQNVAREMNLSETAFLVAQDDGYALRWFTPAVEVPLCGHATLASAHVLWETSILSATAQARFHTRSGLLTAVRRGQWIEMDFPATPVSPTDAPPGLAEALGVTPLHVGKNATRYLVEVASEGTVRQMRPDFSRLAALPLGRFIVTSLADSADFDFVSRFFAPAAGVNEDPVTGAAHCCLSPYWSKRLGRNELIGYQASARGGIVRVRLDGERVHLGGQAITVLKGELV